MRVSEKGQITIPKNLRELAGILPNSEVTMAMEGGRLIVEAADRKATEANRMRMERFLAALSKLEGTGDPTLGAEDVMALTRDR
jgi:AbrB family looped-hinge helix DNA binding protein